MENNDYETINSILGNIRKIMNARNLKQATIAEYANTTPSQMSKILNGTVQLSLNQLANLATSLEMSIIDVISYPDVYVKAGAADKKEPVEAILQIKLQSDKKDQVLKLVFGENNLEILNK